MTQREAIMSAIHHSAKWTKLTKRLKSKLPPICHLCGGAIDLSAPSRSRESWSLDHLVSVENGGAPYDPANCAPAHLSCNGRKSAGVVGPFTPPVPTAYLQPKGWSGSRNW